MADTNASAGFTTIRDAPPARRTALVQALLGKTDTNEFALQWRALLVTALREEGVWPQGCEQS